MASGSVLGAMRDQIFADATLASDLPGGFHANELPADKNLPLPAVVARFLRTDFQFFTTDVSNPAVPFRPQVEKPHVELWLECTDAEQGEALIRRIQNQFFGQTLPLTSGTAFMIHPTDLFLHPATGRNAEGVPQYSWCVPYTIWFVREVSE